ncbi:hypothetical protein N7517_011058 [Penicillium concentricum]|uniref:NACHT domain-containing protein n=1 Tax=Penicillium concentricum TaxID=293559 RepID=A0A9W9RCN5_9EURO|nr:uncharacterized protein N7517_011058 [Penicillium concentricum]KAJ5356449.1 hypothetical protein N7517_011058 [Penicillium concentricum]
MSFGFGVGDFIAVTKIASKIRKDFAEAPSECKAIVDEVNNLSVLLVHVDIDVSAKELSTQQQAELGDILESCRRVLSDLENILDEFRSLETVDKTTKKLSTLKRTWKRFKWETNEIKDLRLRIISNISLLNTFNGRIRGENIKKIVHHQDEEKDRALLEWLSALDYGKRYSDYISRRQDGTGQWLLHSPEFQSWSSGSKKTLFCPGIPGAGKTMLASIGIEELYSRRQDDSSIEIAYLYCNFQQRYGLDMILSSLLKQLARAHPNLPSILSEMYEQHQPKGTRPSTENLTRALHSIVSQTGGFSKIFVIIDALDECQISGGPLSNLLNIVFALQEASGLNFLATSRFIPDIEERFKAMPKLEIRASKEDVTRYLRGNLSNLPNFVTRSEDLQEEISEKITAAVDGMFLLAQLHLNSLEGKRSPKAIRSALNNLSILANYESAYDSAMERIKSQIPDQIELAMDVLAWITCAKRALTTVELQTALAVEIGKSEFDEENIPDLADMVSVCAGLVTVDEQSGIIRLVHYTTQEYFDQKQAMWFPKAHHDISRTCVSYLLLDGLNDDHCIKDEQLIARIHDYPLYEYASTFWGNHLKRELEDTELDNTNNNPVMKLLTRTSFVNMSV